MNKSKRGPAEPSLDDRDAQQGQAATAVHGARAYFNPAISNTQDARMTRNFLLPSRLLLIDKMLNLDARLADLVHQAMRHLHEIERQKETLSLPCKPQRDFRDRRQIRAEQIRGCQSIALATIEFNFDWSIDVHPRILNQDILPKERITASLQGEIKKFEGLKPDAQYTLLRRRDLQRAIQGRCPSIPGCLDNHKGDAQASPSYKQDATDVSPIAVAARHVREYGRSARDEALQTVGMLLKRIDQQKLDKEEVRNVFFTMCIDMFARVSTITLLSVSSDRQLCIQDPFGNIAEVSLAFQLFRVLVQEEILQESDFIRAAITLREEDHYDVCKLFVRLALDDRNTNLTEGEIKALTDIMSSLKLDQNEGKEKVA
ncbi:hypothetical protein A7U60_g1288 [Sanghuangporus baumii]|uniref:Uncharacterized protein n=1 Tax=Sanghuangporus baumii TaxID=108892 RepID=A0A9Q5NEU2_SANBA|nr:hypothetical protein A7U60_g1288 [Sanghuangporus baumii]